MATKNITMDLDRLRYWLALLRTPGIGPAKFHRILKIFPDLAELFQTPHNILQDQGFSPPTAAVWENTAKDLTWLEAAPNHHIISIQDLCYPDLLRQIASPPPLLFIKGDPAILSQWQLAMVGSRNPTPTGLENAREFAKQLVANNIIISSGLALGIDAASHLGALAGSGKTIAVMGTGIDQLYPKKSKNLSQIIIETGGALISEFPIGIMACAENFPRRNRIISGLSKGVLVVEATLRSGSLITAQMANDQGRNVFAIPGSIHNPLARGCHALIKQGAKLVETISDILEEYPECFAIPPSPFVKSSEYTPQNSAPDSVFRLDADYLKLLKCLDYEPVPIDLLLERSGISISALSSMLLILELKGYVETMNGGYKRAIAAPIAMGDRL